MTTTSVNPFLAGMRRAASQGLVPTSMSSREIGLRLSGEVRRAARFSARVENARVLQTISDTVGAIVGGVTEASQARRDAGDGPLLLSMADAKAELLRVLDETGYQPADGEAGTIKDLRSDRRRDLILETNEALIENHGRWVAAQDPIVLDAFPAWELVRISPAEEPRNWLTRWMMAGGQIFRGRMIALKGASVWDALGDTRLFDDALGNPYPPFAWNSGMDLRDIDRQEAEELGVIPKGAAAPRPDIRALTEAMQVAGERFDGAIRAALEADPDLYFDGDVLRSR